MMHPTQKTFLLIFATSLSLSLSGCHSGGAAQANAPVLPLSTDWSKVKALKPESVRGLKFWVSADLIKGVKDGGILKKWVDLSGGKHDLEPSDVGGPVYLSHGMNGKPAVGFDGNSAMEAMEVPGTLLKADEGTVIAVFKQPEDAKLRDLFGFGDCNTNRFLMHSSNQSFVLYFQMGDPVAGRIDAHYKAAVSDLVHVVEAKRNGSLGEVDLDGQRVGQRFDMKTSFNVSSSSSLSIGNSPCNNGFKGAYSQFMIYDRALSRTELDGIMKYLAKEYRVLMPSQI